MKVFADANILISVLNKEFPLFTFTSRILSLAGKPGFEFYTSPVSLAIAFYFAEKKYKTTVAKQKIRLLCEHIEIAEISQAAVKTVLNDPYIKDFEDGLQYYAALNAGCRCILTENARDFYFSKLEVLGSEAFYLKYMAGLRPPIKYPTPP